MKFDCSSDESSCNADRVYMRIPCKGHWGWLTHFSNAIAMEKVYQPTLFSPTSGGFIKIYIEKGTT